MVRMHETPASATVILIIKIVVYYGKQCIRLDGCRACNVIVSVRLSSFAETNSGVLSGYEASELGHLLT